jgi:hypothetical protein
MRALGYDGSDDDVTWKYLTSLVLDGGTITDKLKKYFFNLGYSNQALGDLLNNPGLTVAAPTSYRLQMENLDNILYEDSNFVRQE